VSGDGIRYFVVTDDAIVPLDQWTRWTDSLRSLVDQEVHGQRFGNLPHRVTELLSQFGFEWEPASGPGHMRFLPEAEQILRRVMQFAETQVRIVARDIGMPFDRIEGVNIVDRSVGFLDEYLRLIQSEPALYGAEPYRLAPPWDSLLLRQTSCLQKYSVARDWDLSSPTTIPRCLYEQSDSFRGEPEDDLQLSFRLRRFRLPEAHFHARNVPESLGQALRLHAVIAEDLERRQCDFTMLFSATDAFIDRHSGFLRTLVASSGRPALLAASPPGALCKDGVEVDVEYEIIDATGFARELSTFQVDERITQTFGVSTSDAPVTTIHAVPIGGIERYIFSAFDKIVQVEARGGRARLPLWMAPVVVRVICAGNAGDSPDLARLTLTLESAGLRTEIDDRPLTVHAKAADAVADLVPFQIYVGTADTAPGQIRVTAFDTLERGAITRPLADFLAEVTSAEEFNGHMVVPESRRMSARPPRRPGSPVPRMGPVASGTQTGRSRDESG
jgi:threonyl-tRNA synthetase